MCVIFLNAFSLEGKARDMDNRTTIYKKNDEIVYQLKLKASRAFFSDADKRFGTMPFTLRAFDEEKKAKMGVVECEKHNLMKPFPVKKVLPEVLACIELKFSCFFV